MNTKGVKLKLKLCKKKRKSGWISQDATRTLSRDRCPETRSRDPNRTRDTTSNKQPGKVNSLGNGSEIRRCWISIEKMLGDFLYFYRSSLKSGPLLR